MTVHFIGAGPGAADLITLRGRDLLASCGVCLYAGSLVPEALLAHCPPDARRIDTQRLDLDGILAECLAAHARGQDVARLHSGDLSLYSAVAEQRARLDALGIPTSYTPGVPAYAAAAAALGRELTRPGEVQSVVLTRVSGRATPVPEDLSGLAASGATLAVHLAAPQMPAVLATLASVRGETCPAAVVVRASWPDERRIVGTLGTLPALLAADPPERTAILLVGAPLAPDGDARSALYSTDYVRRGRGW